MIQLAFCLLFPPLQLNMQTFKQFIKEESSPKEAERVEFDVAIVLRELNKDNTISTDEAIEKVKSDIKSTKHLGQTKRMVDLIRGMDSEYKNVAQTDNNEFSDELSSYSIKKLPKLRLKTDVIFTGSGGKVYRISMKLDGDYVLVSADSKSNFLLVFESALQAYIKDFPNDKTVDNFKEKIADISENIVGKKINRILTDTKGENSPEAIKAKVFKKLKPTDDKSKYEKTINKLFDEYEEFKQQKINGVIDEHTEYMSGNLRKEAVDYISEVLNENKTLRNYIVYECMTGYNTFSGSDSSANYILTPSKFVEIKSPNDAIIKKVASQMKIDFRGLPDKSGSYNRVKKLLQGKLKSKNYFDVKLGLKIGISVREEIELNEGLMQSLRGAFNKAKGKIRGIYTRLTKGLKNFIFDSLSKIKNVNDVFRELVGKNVTVSVKFKI